MSLPLSTLPRLPRASDCSLWVGCLALLSFLLYGVTLSFGFVGWDDGMLVVQNPAVRHVSWASLHWIFTHFDPELYIPATFLSYQFDALLGGGSAAFFHATNVLWHTVNAALVSWLAYVLSDGRWRVAVVVSLLFLAHPMQVEAVAWISARKDLLSTAFGLGSILAYLYWRSTGSQRLLVLGAGLFLVALLSKVMVVTVPVLLVAIEWYRGQTLRRSLNLGIVIYACLSGLLGIVAIVGKSDVLSATPPLTAVLIAAKSTVFYVWHFLVPVRFSVLYPHLTPVSLLTWDIGGSVVLILLVTATAVALRRRAPVLAFGLLWYFCALVPTFTNVVKGDDALIYFASDRYAYLPSFGLLLACGLGIEVVLEQRRHWRNVATGAGALVLVVLGVLTFRQLQVWRDTESLFTHAIALAPGASQAAHNNLANAYRLQGEYDQAIAQFQAAIAIRPHPRTLSNLGAVYRKLERYDEARAQYVRALELDSKSVEAHFGLGLLAAAEGDAAAAVAAYGVVLEHAPTHASALSNRGVALLELGRTDEALASFRQAIAAQPYFAEAHYNLLTTQLDLGRTDEALASARRLVDVAPNHIPGRMALGVLLNNSGDVAAAKRQFQAILRLDPNHAGAKQALRQIQ